MLRLSYRNGRKISSAFMSPWRLIVRQRCVIKLSNQFLRATMKARALKIFLLVTLCLQAHAAVGTELGDVLTFLLKQIPTRPGFAMTGSEFAKYVSGMNGPTREQAILTQITRGNLPDFLRKLKPVQLVERFSGEKIMTATLFVMPDYLAIGSDKDFLSIPMDWNTATEIAVRLGFILPTKKIVDAIFQQSSVHFAPEPMPPGPQMRSTAYYLKHHRMIEQQRLASACPLDALVSGHKKDIVLTNRLAREIGRIAIYGWHRLSGIPIQPLSTVHGASYADYSHGIRLVSDLVWIDGEPSSVYNVLENPKLANVLNDEGTIPKVRKLMTLRY